MCLSAEQLLRVWNKYGPAVLVRFRSCVFSATELCCITFASSRACNLHARQEAKAPGGELLGELKKLKNCGF